VESLQVAGPADLVGFQRAAIFDLTDGFLVEALVARILNHSVCILVVEYNKDLFLAQDGKFYAFFEQPSFPLGVGVLLGDFVL
jgi:hypothetical protein